MKIFYLLTYETESKIIGNSFPQCWHFIRGISKDEKTEFYTANDVFFEGDINKMNQLKELYGLRMDRQAKVTDYLHCIVPIIPVINQRMLNLFHEYKEGSYFTLPMTVIRKNEELKYFCYCTLNRYTEYIDYSRSIFRKNNIEFTGLKDFEDYKQKGYPDPVEIYFSKKEIADVDIFVLKRVNNGPDIFISEELAKRLEEENFTGQKIDKEIIAIVD